MPRTPCPPGPRSLVVGANVRALRELRGWSAGDLVERLGGAWTRTVVLKIEVGKANMRVEQLLDLAAAFGVPPSRILKGAVG
jgi:transcriptional regulator with XRE-family HTH domain